MLFSVIIAGKTATKRRAAERKSATKRTKGDRIPVLQSILPTTPPANDGDFPALSVKTSTTKLTSVLECQKCVNSLLNPIDQRTARSLPGARMRLLTTKMFRLQ
jgi:hypothetical protein